MTDHSVDDRALLEQAVANAERALRELIDQQADLDRNPPQIAPGQLIAGRQAMQNAIAAAQRTVAALNDAMAVAQRDSSERN